MKSIHFTVEMLPCNDAGVVDIGGRKLFSPEGLEIISNHYPGGRALR